MPQDLALQLIQFTLIVVTMSILVHGISVKPLLGLFWRRGKPERSAAGPDTPGSDQ